MKLLFFTVLLAFAAGAALAETVVLDGFTLIDGNGGQPLPNAALFIVDGRILWTRRPSQLKAPGWAGVPHFPGKYDMPCIINPHGHLGQTLQLMLDMQNVNGTD